jgi:hypothetical protein
VAFGAVIAFISDMKVMEREEVGIRFKAMTIDTQV